jgi:virulence factor
VESHSARRIFTAFNRRHIPLFQNLPIPAGILQLTGRLTRKNRAVASFPFTAIHLLDSAQFFSKSTFSTINADFEQNGVASWLLSGQLENGASYNLEFIPDGEKESEYLIFETDDRRWELHFPDSDGLAPRASFVSVSGKKRTEELADPTLDSQEAMGFAPCFRYFLRQLTSGMGAFPQHEIRASVPTIVALEAMQKSYVEPVLLTAYEK